jgi:hypothetical protein
VSRYQASTRRDGWCRGWSAELHHSAFDKGWARGLKVGFVLGAIAAALLAFTPRAGAAPPCGKNSGPQPCAESSWFCFSPERVRLDGLAVIKRKKDLDICLAEKDRCVGHSISLINREREKRRIDADAAAVDKAIMLRTIKGLEAAQGDRGHPTWVVVTVAVGAVVVGGVVAGLAVYYGRP